MKTEKQNYLVSVPRGVEVSAVGLKFNGKMSYDEWEQFGDKLQQAHASLQFWLGDWCILGEAAFAQEFSQAITDYAKHTAQNATWVCSRIPLSRRREGLTFTHHEAVAALEAEEQSRFLELASCGWSTRTLRAAVQAFKRNIAAPRTATAEIEPEPDSAPAKNKAERTTSGAFDTDTVSQRIIEFLNSELHGASAAEVSEVLAAIVAAFMPSDADGFDWKMGIQRGAVPYVNGSGRLQYADSVNAAWREIKAEHARKRARA